MKKYKKPKSIYYETKDPLTGIPVHIAFGKERRKAVMDLFYTNPNHRLCVNKTWCPQMKRDRDLQHLVKKGKLKQINQFDRTYLVLPDLSGQFCKIELP